MRSHRTIGRVAALAAMLVLVGGVVLVPTSAQTPTISRTESRLPVVEDAGFGGMVFWSEGRLAFQFKFLLGGRFQVASLDLDTLAPTGLVSEPVILVAGYQGVAVDETNGLLYLPRGPNEFQTCNLLGTRCLTGVIVMDARTLKIKKILEYPAQGAIFPRFLSLSYSPGKGPEDSSKLYVLTQETAGTNTSIHWLAQWDPEKPPDATNKHQDWITRLEACTTFRQDEYGSVPFSHAAFRAPGVGRNFIYVGCYGTGATAQALKIPIEATGLPGIPEVFPGPNGVASIMADPVSERLLVMAQKEGLGQSFWVFDGKRSSFIGVVGISPTVSVLDTSQGIDPTTGRLYVLAPKSSRVGFPDDTGGLLYVDARRTPLPQAVKLPQFATTGSIPILVDPETPTRPRRIFIRPGSAFRDAKAWYEVFEDRTPLSSDAVPDDYSSLTDDVDPNSGPADINFTGTGRGYGFRALVLGGAEALGRDPQGGDFSGLVRIFSGACGPTDREAIFGFLGPGRLTDTDASAVAEPLSIDGITREDAAKPMGRCTGNNLDAARTPDPLTRADCATPEKKSGRTGDGFLAGFVSEVKCGETLEGFSRARLGELTDQVKVGEALSTFKIYRDDKRGLVSRTESVSRGIELGGGIVKIDSVSAVAESWANGRKQPSGKEVFANCDFTRSAGTCFTRTIGGLTTPTYSCDPCLDEKAAVAAMNRALGIRGRVRLRDPDPELRLGSGNGYLASVQKPDTELFVDAVLHNDGQTTLPVLEFIRIVDGAAGRGRQIFQFAGVESAAAFGIQQISQGTDGGFIPELPVDVPIFANDFTETVSEVVPGPEKPVLFRVVETAARFLRGMVILLASPRDALMMAGVWALLVLPAYLAERRRLVDQIVVARGWKSA